MKLLKYSVVLFVICVLILTLKLTYFYPSVKNQVVWDAVTTEKIIDLPDSPYECKTFKAVVGEDIIFCKLTTDRPMISGKPTVMGDFNSSLNRIRITKETSKDAIVHELIHYAISCTRKTKDEELCVRSAQKTILELDLIKK